MNRPVRRGILFPLFALALLAVIVVAAAHIYKPDPGAMPNCDILLQGSAATFHGPGAKVSGTTVTITRPGRYHISGTLDDGQILVDAKKSSDVYLVLEGMQITCTDNAPIYVKKAASVHIELAEGTENSVSDGAVYALPENKDEPDAAIFSRAALTFSGAGSLAVNGNCAMAVRGKETVTVAGGTIALRAVDDGLKGRNGVAVTGGDLSITAGSEGIQAGSQTSGQGTVELLGGRVDITAGRRGVKALTDVTVQDGQIHIRAGLDGVYAMETVRVSGGTLTIDAEDDGIQASAVDITGGVQNITAGGTRIKLGITVESTEDQ